MSERLTNILGYVALFAILGAIWILFGESNDSDTLGDRKAMFPKLEESINLVDKITLSDAADQIIIQKDGGVWRILSKDAYPASAPKVRRFLLQLLQASRLEPRTDDPALMHKIGLGQAALGVTVSKQDAVVARLKIGKQKSVNEAFVLIGDEPKSWLVQGVAKVTTDISDWADTRLIPIAGADIASVTLTDGQMLRRDNSSGIFSADSKTEVIGFKAEELVGYLSNIQFHDVQGLANPLNEPVGLIGYKTYSGVTVALSLYQDAVGLWAQAEVKWAESDIAANALIDGDKDPATFAAQLDQRLDGWFFLISNDPNTPLTAKIDAFSAPAKQ